MTTSTRQPAWARADEFIHDLDDGYETVIDGGGGDLSQGQLQLLSIARAMIADTPVMILGRSHQFHRHPD